MVRRAFLIGAEILAQCGSAKEDMKNEVTLLFSNKMILNVILWLLKSLGKTIIAASLCWLYKELTMGICKCTKSLEGKVAVVTGASSGLGLETTLQLAKRGCHVIMGCRNQIKAKKAVAFIR